MKTFVAGHRGMVGSAIVRAMATEVICRTRSELDLTNQTDVRDFFREEQPDVVILAAAKVGGIHANNEYPGQFIYENLAIQNNVIHEAHSAGVKKLLFLGSSCIYPKLAFQPMAESALLSGALEPTNEPYAIAKIAGIKLCESYNRQYGVDYRSVMPTNLYGEGDNFHPENSHVLPALLQRFHNARIDSQESIQIWGSGKPRREFLHVDDMAEACLFVLNLDRETYLKNTNVSLSHINVGTGVDISIHDLAHAIADITGYEGKIEFDTTKPDGAPQKLLNVSRLKKMGWEASIDLRSGIEKTYQWYLDNVERVRAL